MQANKHEIVWKNCLSVIADIVPHQTFRTWFQPIVPVQLTDRVLTIEVPSNFFMEYLEANLVNYIKLSLQRELGEGARLQYSVKVDSGSKPLTYPHQENPEITNRSQTFTRTGSLTDLNPVAIPGIQQLRIDPQLNSSLSFDNFVEGPCNRLARQAGLAITRTPGATAFNPLFIFGGPGLGKTHLAQAIGIEIKQKKPEKVVLYVNANRFMIQYMDAVNVKNKLADFLHFYQMMDVLILDDVQEFSGKTGTMNAFFHIFNHLQQNGKQLILTSDRAPVDLKDLDDRLMSRFKWGLSAELLPPDYATRVAIIRKKSGNDGVELPEDVVDYLATTVTTNIREMEGTLVSLLAQATLLHKPINLELAHATTENLVNTKQQNISVGDIQKAVCNYFGLSPDSLASKTRKREICQARQIAMYLSRNLTKNSLASIGALIGGKDHATVLHSYNTVCNLMDTDQLFRQYVSDIEKRLKAN